MSGGFKVLVFPDGVGSYVLHDAAVGGGRAAEVGNLEADVQVCRRVGDYTESQLDYRTAGLRRWRRLLPGTVVSRVSTSTTSLGSVAAETRGAARARTVVNRADCILAENKGFGKK
jgi:hypothetical protein